MLKCILFDLDGVLVEACDWHRVALNKAIFNVAGFELTDDEHKTTFNGLPTKNKLELLVKQNRIRVADCSAIWEKKQIYTKETILSMAKIEPDKIELHRYAKSLGIKLACITNSIMETAMLMLTSTGQAEYMDLVVSNEEVNRPKPHGEGYIYAMVYFHSYPKETLIVEDSEVGLTAARTTSANIWQVKNSYDVILDNLKEQLK